MSPDDAFEDEMALLRNREPDPEVADLAQALRAYLLVPIEEEQVAGMATRLAAVARANAAAPPTEPLPATRLRRSRIGLAGKIAVAVAAIPLATAGFAAAGFQVPGPAQSAFESIGLALPNQDGSGDDGAEGSTSGEPSDGDGPASGFPAEGIPGQGSAGDGRGRPAKPGRSESAPAGSKSKGKSKGKSESSGKSGAPGQNKAPKQPATGKGAGKVTAPAPGGGQAKAKGKPAK